jgi:chemotaxis protein methyltransferase CheR
MGTAVVAAPRPPSVAAGAPVDPGLEDLEVQLLLEGIHRAYGVDLRNDAPGSLRRRLRRHLEGEGLETISDLQAGVLHDPRRLGRLLDHLAVTTTSMFRDPAFYRALRDRVVPMLRTYPSIRVWSAGCSTGEEVYSVAILLQEQGLYDRACIYATDMSAALVERARDGSFPLEKMREYTTNYIAAGGTRPFSEYYTVEGGRARFAPSLAENVVFGQHNLVTDRSFNEFNLVLCRNVMIYFDRPLQDRIHGLLCDSLVMFGVLGLGARESLRFTKHRECYEEVVPGTTLHRRVA